MDTTNGKEQRIFLFIIYVILLLVLFLIWKGSIFPASNDTIGIIIYTALLMLAFVPLFLEHHFTRPSDVLASTISILLLISPIKDELEKFGIWYWFFFSYNLSLAFTSLASLLLLTKEKPEDSKQNQWSKKLKLFSITFGKGKIIFFLLFAGTMFAYVNSQSIYFLLLFFYSVAVLLIEPQNISRLLKKDQRIKINDIGEIFGVQSKNTFLVKLYPNANNVKKFDFVQMKYSLDGERKMRKGLIVDNYLLNQESWIKVLICPEIQEYFPVESDTLIVKENIVYKIEPPQNSEYLERFIGIIIENSNIGKVCFSYNSTIKISEGRLLEVTIDNNKVLYQVVEGTTKTEVLEQKNERGFIVGEAIQLGTWNNVEFKFEKYGWVPSINSPVFLASNIDTPKIDEDYFNVGNIPDTNYPVLLNRELAVTHHLAILGVTGCGKSVFTRNLMKEIIKDGTKVICVDFTGEYKKVLSLPNIITEKREDKIFEYIDKYISEMDKFPNNRQKPVLDECDEVLENTFQEALEEFLTDNNLQNCFFELPDVSNSLGILEYTRRFFKALFVIAKEKKNYGKRVCVILEEAHTVIPEWNFIGSNEKSAPSVVTGISQIALQGRKYDVGFIVIAQRTANVSKTVLTQCNSIIVFQEYDNTSKEFLSNYLNDEMITAISNLKQRQAIAVGKAFKSTVPLIFQVPEINETANIKKPVSNTKTTPKPKKVVSKE